MDLLTREAMHGLVFVSVGTVKFCPALDVFASDRTTVKESNHQDRTSLRCCSTLEIARVGALHGFAQQPESRAAGSLSIDEAALSLLA
jgi:hypothetical protein